MSFSSSWGLFVETVVASSVVSDSAWSVVAGSYPVGGSLHGTSVIDTIEFHHINVNVNGTMMVSALCNDLHLNKRNFLRHMMHLSEMHLHWLAWLHGVLISSYELCGFVNDRWDVNDTQHRIHSI